MEGADVAGYTVLDVDQMERAYGGVFVRARASLGARGFGFQVIDLPPSSGDFYPEHDHSHDAQEEVYVLLDGEAEIVFADAAVDLEPNRFVLVSPETRRRVRSGPAGCRLLVIGAPREGRYVPPEFTELGGPEVFVPGASSAADPASPPPSIATRGRYSTT